MSRPSRCVTFAFGVLAALGILVFVALAIGLGFEFVKWLGNTQK